MVNLGAFGAVTQLTLDLQPTFDVRQYAFERLPFDELIDNFELIFETGYSVSVFTTWSGDAAHVLVKSRSDDVPTMFSAAAATVDLPNFTPQLGVAGPWSDRLAHFAMESTPSVGAEVQSEYLVAREDAGAAVAALRRHSDQITPLLHATEIRTVAGSELWLDPAYQRDSVSIGFTWKPMQEAVERLLPLVESALAEFDPRPHWGKLFALDAATLSDRYDKLADFRQMAEYFDPKAKFRNDFLRRTVWG